MKTILQEMVRPRRLERAEKSEDNTYGKYIAEPMERGFGVTVGNALRRYLLSSIPGGAVVSLKIDGINHEFSTLPNVYEDVSEIILNVKELIIQHDLETDDGSDKLLTVDVSGKGEVTGADVVCPAGIEIINKDLHLATLMDKSASFKMEMVSTIGKGYVPSEDHDLDSTDIALIPVDSNFSPVRKVNYTIEKTRVGGDTNYDKLILEVWTDGTINPEDAISFAAKLQRDHMLLFMNREDDEIIPTKAEAEEKKKPTINLNRSVEEMELSVRSYNCLQKANIATIAELVGKTDSEMLKTRNFGRKSLNEIKDILAEMGLRLGMSQEEIDEHSQG